MQTVLMYLCKLLGNNSCEIKAIPRIKQALKFRNKKSFKRNSQHCLAYLLASLQYAFITYFHDQFQLKEA